MAIGCDIRDIGAYLYGGMIPHFLDLGEPVAVLAGAVLHYLSGTDVATVLDEIANATVSGTYLALTHTTPETGPDSDPSFNNALDLINRTPTPITPRTRAELTRLSASVKPSSWSIYTGPFRHVSHVPCGSLSDRRRCWPYSFGVPGSGAKPGTPNVQKPQRAGTRERSDAGRLRRRTSLVNGE